MSERQEDLIHYGLITLVISMIYGAIFFAVIMWEFRLAEAHAGFHTVDILFYFVQFPAGYFVRFCKSIGLKFTDEWLAFVFDAVFWALITLLIYLWISNCRNRKRDKGVVNK